MPHQRLTPTAYLRDNTLVLKHQEVRMAIGIGPADFQKKVRRAAARSPALRSYMPGIPKKIPADRSLEDPRYYDIAWIEEALDMVFFRTAPGSSGGKARLKAVFAAAKADPALVQPWPERDAPQEASAASPDKPEEMPEGEAIQPEPEFRERQEDTALAIPEKYRRIHTICKATPGHVGVCECDVVDARDLYAGLGVTMEWGKWINRRILQNPEFQEGVDFCSPDVASKRTGRGGYNATECLVTLKTARKVSMAEGGDVGNLVRDYYCWTEGIVEEIVQQAPGPDLTALVSGMQKAVADAIAGIPAAIAAAAQSFATQRPRGYDDPSIFITPAPRTSRRDGQMSITRFIKYCRDIMGAKLDYEWVEEWLTARKYAERNADGSILLATSDGYRSGYVVNYAATGREDDGRLYRQPSRIHLTPEGVKFLAREIRRVFSATDQGDFFRREGKFEPDDA